MEYCCVVAHCNVSCCVFIIPFTVSRVFCRCISMCKTHRFLSVTFLNVVPSLEHVKLRILSALKVHPLKYIAELVPLSSPSVVPLDTAVYSNPGFSPSNFFRQRHTRERRAYFWAFLLQLDQLLNPGMCALFSRNIH